MTGKDANSNISDITWKRFEDEIDRRLDKVRPPRYHESP
jgi:hypothetical protein